MIVSGRAPLYGCGCLTGFVVKYECQCQHECGEVEVCKLVYNVDIIYSIVDSRPHCHTR